VVEGQVDRPRSHRRSAYAGARGSRPQDLQQQMEIYEGDIMLASSRRPPYHEAIINQVSHELAKLESHGHARGSYGSFGRRKRAQRRAIMAILTSHMIGTCSSHINTCRPLSFSILLGNSENFTYVVTFLLPDLPPRTTARLARALEARPTTTEGRS
jgi:hypothetical protein